MKLLCKNSKVSMCAFQIIWFMLKPLLKETSLCSTLEFAPEEVHIVLWLPKIVSSNGEEELRYVHSMSLTHEFCEFSPQSNEGRLLREDA